MGGEAVGIGGLAGHGPVAGAVRGPGPRRGTAGRGAYGDGPALCRLGGHPGGDGADFLGGAFSHAVRKGPLLRRGEGVRGDRDSRGDLERVEASADQRAVARAALAAAPGASRSSLLYARVDVVAGDDGRALLLELELTEPSLFLPQAPEAAQRFAGAVEAELPTGASTAPS